MKKTQCPSFVWSDEVFPAGLQGDVYFLAIPAGVEEKEPLLHIYAEQGQFPAWFGGNWDALADCLADLSWLEVKKMVIVHADMPFARRPDLRDVYLELLRDVMALPKAEGYPALEVVFPTHFRLQA